MNGGGPGGVYARNPAVAERRVDDSVFLARTDTDEIYHLNATGAALWRLLAEPASAEEAAAVLHQAFPGVPRETVEAEVAALMTDLARRGLITPAR